MPAHLAGAAGEVGVAATVGDVDVVLRDAQPLHQRIRPLLCTCTARSACRQRSQPVMLRNFISASAHCYAYALSCQRAGKIHKP